MFFPRIRFKCYWQLATTVYGYLHFVFEINISWRFPFKKNLSEYTLICKIVKRIGRLKCGKHRLTSSHVACRIFEPLSVAWLPLRRLKTFKRNLCSSSANYCYFLNQRNSFFRVTLKTVRSSLLDFANVGLSAFHAFIYCYEARIAFRLICIQKNL